MMVHYLFIFLSIVYIVSLIITRQFAWIEHFICQLLLYVLLHILVLVTQVTINDTAISCGPLIKPKFKHYYYT